MAVTASSPVRVNAQRSWWPLYLLGLLAAVLFAGDWLLPLSEGWRTFLLLPILGLLCALVLRWVGRNEQLLSSEGVDAKVREDPILQALLMQARGVEYGEPS